MFQHEKTLNRGENDQWERWIFIPFRRLNLWGHKAAASRRHRQPSTGEPSVRFTWARLVRGKQLVAEGYKASSFRRKRSTRHMAVETYTMRRNSRLAQRERNGYASYCVGLNLSMTCWTGLGGVCAIPERNRVYRTTTGCQTTSVSYDHL